MRNLISLIFDNYVQLKSDLFPPLTVNQAVLAGKLNVFIVINNNYEKRIINENKCFTKTRLEKLLLIKRSSKALKFVVAR